MTQQPSPMHIDADLQDSQGRTINDPRCNCRELMEQQIWRDTHAPIQQVLYDSIHAKLPRY